MSKRWHGDAEIVAKLEQAERLAAQGKTQREIAHMLGISIMTYHRWRNAHRNIAPAATPEGDSPRTLDELEKIAELQLENSRLRRLVTDLLLEKIQIQEELERPQNRKAKI